ncbi:MAG TPA: hypothetical protein VEK84_18220 [Terriglobales bacterium]|nr:hypothetical protein [Terriglobales bacterium]
MRKFSLLFALSIVVLLPILAVGQAPSQPTNHKIDNDFVQAQFGNQFTLLPEVGAMFGDLDGDGVEDAVIAARCKNPLLDEAEHNYTVLDPYYTFYGYGDPKLTTTFREGDPARQGLVVLIIHGVGPEGWRSAAPKSKFVIVNLPYRAVSVRKMQLRKKTIEAVYIEEGGELAESSALFFDGKKYKYVPMGASMQ